MKAQDAAISVSGRKAVITSPDQSVSLSFSRSVKMSVLDEKEGSRRQGMPLIVSCWFPPEWAGASRTMNVPLIIGEGSTDAAAHQYPDIFNETTFALYEINLYTRLCALCQPLSILQWQLTSDYSVLWGDGIYRSEGPLRPTQRFFNLQQLASTPENAFSVPVTCDKNNVNAAAFANIASGACALHIVNNGASCDAVISGFPADATGATVRITNTDQNSEASYCSVSDGRLEVSLPADSFVSIFVN